MLWLWYRCSSRVHSAAGRMAAGSLHVVCLAEYSSGHPAHCAAGHQGRKEVGEVGGCLRNACATHIGAHAEHCAHVTVLCVRCSTV